MSRGEPNALLEFGGAPGNALLTVALPAITIAFFYLVRLNDGDLVPHADPSLLLAALTPTPQAAND